jgi:hypothetical protein
MAIDYAAIAAAGGIPKGTPSGLAKHQKNTEHDRKLAKAYAVVNDREANTCQVSGAQLLAATKNPKRLREHHHLKGRNVKPEWVYEPRRILLVSKWIHDFLTANVILVDGTDATKPLVFRWNRNLVKPGKEPARLERVQ